MKCSDKEWQHCNKEKMGCEGCFYNDEIKVTHPNGYSGILYGKRSMSIVYNNEEVLHTGFRNINTEEELYKKLENMPEFLKMLDESFDEYMENKIKE